MMLPAPNNAATCARGALLLCCAAAPQVERLVCGNPNLDFDALERNAKYEGGFSFATHAVQWLWQVRVRAGSGQARAAGARMRTPPASRRTLMLRVWCSALLLLRCGAARARVCLCVAPSRS